MSTDNARVKKTKNQRRRERAKEKKLLSRENGVEQTASRSPKPSDPIENAAPKYDDDYDYHEKENETAEQVDLAGDYGVSEVLNDPQFAAYRDIMSKFSAQDDPEDFNRNKKQADGRIFYSDSENEDQDQKDSERDQDNTTQSLQQSKRKLRKLHKVPLAELKSRAPRPELVEWFDADAPDPDLVVQIKAARGVVGVPDHWQLKRDYLSSKRGNFKRPFDLPPYIKSTGIMEMRDALKEDDRSLQQKMREKVQPKMGRLDVDYQKLHDAFFKLQTKPRMYGYGQLYYEGRENDEIDFNRFRPGKLSKELTEALNIPPLAPPPWLLNMQQHGPPPSYPGLKIPGLNAPIPQGAQWGFQPGGYGRPPLDEKGNPLYGDVYGTGQKEKLVALGRPVEKEHWGQLIEEEESDIDQSDEEEEGEEMDEDEGAGYVDEEAALAAQEREDREAANKAQFKREGSEEPGEFPLELRKSKRGVEVIDEGEPEPQPESAPRALYEVLERKEVDSGGFLGSKTGYEIPGEARKRRRFEGPPSAAERAAFQADLDELIDSESRRQEHKS